jgi:hypothetical protein
VSEVVQDQVDQQRRRALRSANEKRKAVKNVRHSMMDGVLPIRDVLLPTPRVAIEGLAAVDVVRWAPRLGAGNPNRATANTVALGVRAMQAGVNLLVPVGDLSFQDREWLAERAAPGPQPPSIRSRRSRYLSREVGDLAGSLMSAEGQLERMRLERDLALGRVEELERQVRGRQLVMPTVAAEEMLAAVVDAVEVHRRSVQDQSLPPSVWASADEVLWAEKDRVLAGDLREAA